ncbi:MAG: uracil-DNA glycosylase [Ahniella sp.]|nr:uracil-DNA glycosylase [Ahniella sp.]
MTERHGDRIQLDPSWKTRLHEQFESDYMAHLRAFLIAEKQAGKTLYPPSRQIFAALDATPFEQVKVVILGQDPYHGPGQAHGLCFSVQEGTDVPPSLRNIQAELTRDLGLPKPSHGHLMSWAQQGVLLLNAVLTVEHGLAGSHQGKGWERFTDAIVDLLNREGDHLVFLLWGSHAQAKGRMVDGHRHLVLKAPHPSPLSAHRGFIGCGHFSRANEWLVAHGKTPIDWRVV